MAEENKAIEVIEKRRYLRLDDYFKVEFRPTSDLGRPDAEQEAEVGYSKNVSLGGLAFVTRSAVDAGQVVQASIQIPEIDSPIEFVGEVIRCIEHAPDRFELAIKFLPFGIDEEQRNKLELFIYDHFLSDPL